MSRGIGKAWGKDFQERINVERFKVHSVFNTVCNLQSSEGKPLLSLVTRTEAQGSNTLLVEGIYFRTLTAGSILTWDDCKLLCGEVEVDCTALRSNSVRLKTRVSKTLRPNNKRLDNTGPDSPNVMPAMVKEFCSKASVGNSHYKWDSNRSQFNAKLGLSAILNLLREVEFWLDLQFPGISHFNPELENNLVQSWDKQDPKLTMSALRGLIGSGEGLTPAGDDFVAGLLLGLTRGETDDQNEYQEQLAGTLWHEARRTNAISRTMLWYAAQGEGARYLTRAADDLLTASPAVFESAANLLRIGRTSGRYLLAGLIRGCKIFVRERDHGRTDCG